MSTSMSSSSSSACNHNTTNSSSPSGEPSSASCCNADIDRKLANHEVELAIPEGAELLDQQVAGHRFGISRHKLGLLRHTASRDILKPVCDKRSEREWRFYELVWRKGRSQEEDPKNLRTLEPDDDDECVRKLQSLVPQFNGLFSDPRMSVNYIRLADITSGLVNASVLDMKIGRITYDHEASESKRKSELGKYRYAQELGFRILGMRIFDKATQQYVVKDKDCGVQVTPDNASQALLTFVQRDARVLAQLHAQLSEIRSWFRESNRHRWKFISSSIFLVYGQPEESQLCFNNQNHANPQDQDHEVQKEEEPRALIKMIDFAHVFPNPKPKSKQDPESSAPAAGGDQDGKEEEGEENYADGIDWNYLYGLDKLDHYLQVAREELNNNPNNSNQPPTSSL